MIQTMIFQKPRIRNLIIIIGKESFKTIVSPKAPVDLNGRNHCVPGHPVVVTSAAVATATATPSRACAVPHQDLGEPTLQGNPFRTTHCHHSPVPIPTETPNAGCRFPCSGGGSPHRTWCSSLSVPGDSTAPKWRCVERPAAPAPLHLGMQWHTRARAVRGGPRGVHTAPRAVP